MYNQFNIFFKYKGFEEIDSPVIMGDTTGYYVLENTDQYDDLTDWAIANSHFKENAMNVYVFGWGIGFGGAGVHLTQLCGVNSIGVAKSTLPHEIGHNLNLFHTRSFTERVTRDMSDDCFNASEVADYVVDTAANRGFSQGGTYPYINPDCTYQSGNEFDNCNPPRDYGDEITLNNVKNLLGDAYICIQEEWYLSPGQGIRAWQTIEETTYLDDALNIDGIESLYEPYTGSYPEYYPHPLPWEYPLFQPGFDYIFVECQCDCNDISTYGPVPYVYTNFNTSSSSLLTISKYETDFKTITHPNHSAIDIDLGTIEACNLEFAIPRRCYDNWYSPPVIGGDVIKFNDGVFNNNVTITPQDSTSINNPNLIIDLQPGLYNIIKTDINGNNNENVILKENE